MAVSILVNKTTLKKKLKYYLKIATQFVFNPRLLLCFGIAWMITNGWSYVLFGLGTYFGIPWMVAVGGGYMAFLWIPATPEKIVTVAISIALLRFFFPNDEKTLGMLKKLRIRYQEKHKDDKEEENEEHSE